MAKEFRKKLIEVTIQFNSGTLDAPVYGAAKTFSGLHISAQIEALAGGNQSFAVLRIYGMEHSDMNRLTVTGSIQQENRFNKVSVSAGEVGGLMQIVHTGYIDTGFINSQTQPSRLFEIHSRTALAEQMRSVKASSFKGSVRVSAILAELARDANLTFVDKGIGTIPLDNAYFTGDPIAKIRECCHAAGIEYDINNDTLTVWLSGSETKSGIVISAKDGNNPLMIGTPSCSGYELTVATQFYTGFNYQDKVKVESNYNKPVNGYWLPVKISHDLECLNPHGSSNWRTVLECVRGA